ncbi:MAG TPA: hypothetical protein VGR96_20235 [Acidobacteriaceae bacterium]|nr:hypothetical protein [Acidobacteriaceae bacterium]
MGVAGIVSRILVALLLCFELLHPGSLRAQDNYEIQVYPSETMAPKTLLTELHSNFTAQGSTTTQYGFLPTEHQEHETIELTQGINDWSEVGFYFFTAESSGHGVQWVGDHIRPRVRIPPSWHWPVGVSLSNEIGYARPAYSIPTWSWQFMPIVDQTLGKWYWSVNTTMNWGINAAAPPGLTPQQKQVYFRDISPRGITFGPAATLTYAPSKYYNVGLEYYSYYGEIGNFVSAHNQQQQIFPVVNLFVSPKWEVNFGVGWGATAGTDHLIVKAIVGRYFDWSHHRPLRSDITP